MPDAEFIIVTTTAPTQELAERIARAAVEEHLAACAQVTGPFSSTYRWRERVESATEWGCQLKTTRDRFAALESRIRALHPYEVPEILATDIAAGSKPYLEWIRTEVDPTPRP
jgi:periplasmic divalent cation tolerance protein